MSTPDLNSIKRKGNSVAYFDVTYDLVGRKEAEYQELWDGMDRLGAVKYQDSAYFVELNNTAPEVKDHLRSYIHEKDRLMVVEFTKRPSYTRCFTAGHEWLKARFP
jgi:hypothetical protein